MAGTRQHKAGHDDTRLNSETNSERPTFLCNNPNAMLHFLLLELQRPACAVA